ncbi:MAG: hypothetical protein D6820_04795, partial [Lentisphaerae bacterium]
MKSNRLLMISMAIMLMAAATGTETKNALTFNTVRILKNSPCELSELLFFNHDSYICMGRESLTYSRTDHEVFCPLLDRDLKTRARWEKLTLASIIHANWHKYGYRFHSKTPVTATNLYLVTPDVKSLKGSSISFFLGGKNLLEVPLAYLTALGPARFY